MKQYKPELSEDVTKLEEIVDLPTVYKIVEAASGIKLAEVMNDHRLCSHLDNVRRVRTVEFGAVTLLVMVMLSVVASVVIVTPVPATRVRVSFVPSAATVVCPATATLPKAFAPVALLVMVKVSVPASVVSVIPVPAAMVRVSVVLSATMLDCPATAIVLKMSPAAAGASGSQLPLVLLYVSTLPLATPVVSTSVRESRAAPMMPLLFSTQLIIHRF